MCSFSYPPRSLVLFPRVSLQCNEAGGSDVKHSMEKLRAHLCLADPLLRHEPWPSGDDFIPYAAILMQCSSY